MTPAATMIRPTEGASATVPSAASHLWPASAMLILTFALTVFTAQVIVTAAEPGIWFGVLSAVAGLFVLSCALPFLPLYRSFRFGRSQNESRKDFRIADQRVWRSRAIHAARLSMGRCLPIIAASVFMLFLAANNSAVQKTFFDADFMLKSLPDIAAAFTQNIIIAVAAEVLVLVWAMVVAIAKLAPGSAGRPIRWLATAYVNMFRAIPAIIVIYLLGFGLPLAGVPILSDLSPMWAAIIALTLTYGAYVAEVYRAGIEGIHSSQTLAARSLGLSYGKTLRFVVVPQALRKVTPPLLNDFIGLQKDTALVTVIGTVEAFTQAKTYASGYFNLSSVTVVALLFIIITIPQTRFVDRLMDRPQRRIKAKAKR